MSNYMNLNAFCLFQEENPRKQFLQLTFLSLPNQNISMFLSSLNVSLQTHIFLPCHFTFCDFFLICKLTLFMVNYTTWVCWDGKKTPQNLVACSKCKKH